MVDETAERRVLLNCLLAIAAMVGFGLPFFIAGTVLLVTDTRLRVEVVSVERLAGECYFCSKP